MQPDLLKHLESFITDRRKGLFRQTISQRTRYLTVVLEDLYQPHNASAVLRTCECFGIQDIHIIEGRNKYQVNPDIALGASKWLTLYHYPPDERNTQKVFSLMKKRGYLIAATVPDPSAVSIDKYDLSKGKTALIFGTELTGLSDEAINMADESVYIPMYGLTESFNISVSVALVLYQFTKNLRNSTIRWQLTPAERDSLYGEWLVKSIKSAPEIISRWERQHISERDNANKNT